MKIHKGPPKTVAIIPSAGAGVRMKSTRAKQFLDLCGKPILSVTIEAFEKCTSIDSIILVCPKTEISYCQEEIVKKNGFKKVIKIVEGGKRRQDSVRLGLEACNTKYDLVSIHDGVRPLVSVKLIEKTITEALIHRAVIAGMPAKETVKEVDRNNLIVKTHDREKIWLIQTPQVFLFDDIIKAHRMAVDERWEVTDDAMMVEKLGIKVKVIEGSIDNIKITTQSDLELARILYNKIMDLKR